jgi:hypothetical protein
LTLAQVPTVPARLHARQAVLQALLQQTPCEQKLLAHSAAAEQAAPGGLRPQLLTMPFIPQVAGARHCVLAVQAVKHRLALHRYGAQDVDAGLVHWPAPLQVDGAVYESFTQVSAAQTVPFPYRRHPPVPSHRPSVPHVAAVISVHICRGSTVPAATGVQRPSAPDKEQL